MRWSLPLLVLVSCSSPPPEIVVEQCEQEPERPALRVEIDPGAAPYMAALADAATLWGRELVITPTGAEFALGEYCKPDELACVSAAAQRIAINERLVDTTIERVDDACDGEYSILGALTHELGHAWGLKHSDDPSSVMYPELPPCEERKPTEAEIATSLENVRR